MQSGFQCFYDVAGDLQVTDGVVISRADGAVFHVGSGGAGLAANPPPSEGVVHTPGRESAGTTFPGGSGRNLACATVMASGITRLSFFRPEVMDEYRFEDFLLVKTGASAATIGDATAVVAELTTGGTAPVGSFVLTTYGEDTYNGGTPLTLVITAEGGGPGTIPDVILAITGGTAMGGRYTAVDASTYVSATDPDWTLELQTGGAGHLKYDSTLVAVRAEGSEFDPSGGYVAEAGAYFYNPVAPAAEDQGERPAVNPFGVLTLVYSWPATPDLDTTTTFLAGAVGYPGPYLADYMTHSGDDTGPSGTETVVIDLASAWDDEVISTFADIACFADWFPGAGGAGLATLDIAYTIGALAETHAISPGGISPAATLVKSLRVLAAGTLAGTDASWTATTKRIPVPPRAGRVYLKLTETAGVLSAVEGPFFATTQPTNTATEFYFPLATSDGTGGLLQLHTGAVVW